MLKKVLGVAAVAILVGLASAAQADSLHGFCVTASDCSAATVNGNPLIQFLGTSQFGFWDAGGPVTGTDEIVILSTTNLGAFIPLNVNVGASPTVMTSAGLFSSTAWSSGFLDSYLGISANPANPFNNYGGPSGIDSTVSGFYVYTATGTDITLDDQAGELNNPLFTVPGGLASGDFALDFLLPTDGDKWIGTPNSEALGSTGNTPPSVPEPSSLSMLGIGLLGMVGFARRRFQTA